MNEAFEVGVLVKSLNGRDRNKIYIVLKKTNENYCEVVDGNVRTKENPKRKNIKHLEVLGIRFEEIQIKQNTNEISNAEIHELIKLSKNQKEKINAKR